MIIRTRYRDVPAEDVGFTMSHPEHWPPNRGMEILIRTPATNMPIDGHVCDGPTYRCVNPDGEDILSRYGTFVSVCHHIAEIGD